MNIQVLNLYNYRNYKQLNLTLFPNINIFTGFNAQGKTNIIEAIHLASLGISHRTRIDKDLIYWGDNKASINIKFTRREILSQINIKLDKIAKKELNYNGDNIKQKELPGLLTMVLFSPEDLMLIKGAPLQRRRFLDIELSQVSSRYYNELVQYNRLLQQRNNLLKKIRENNKLVDMLDMWDEQFAKVAAFIVEMRLRGMKKISEIAKIIHQEISQQKEILNVQYNLYNFDKNIVNTEIPTIEELYNFYRVTLNKYRNKDIFRGSTSVGPHRDDIDFYINDISLKSFGSQGQQRSSVLSLKLAELEFLKGETGEYPILLLDDVMSELDVHRRENLLTLLQEKNIQTLITATDKDLFTTNSKNHFFQVENGNVTSFS